MLSRTTLTFLLIGGLATTACNDDISEALTDGVATDTDTSAGSTSDGPEAGGGEMAGDGDGDGDGDGEMPGDGDGEMPGDGDGEMPGDGDGEMPGDGDGEMPGDGDGEMPGDGDGEMPGDGDGDGDGACADGCGTPNCGPCPDGPVGVQISNYSIDSTEVSFAQYSQFLNVDFDPAYLDDLLPAGCEFKTNFVPNNWPLDPEIDLPVVWVDWCDAAAYCSWAGKRLCGAIGGGPAELGDVQNAANNEWYRACTGGGLKNYPYGLIYDGTACNTVDAGFEQLTNVGSIASCVGGYPGIYDMSGNAWEWTNACNDNGECRRRGGSYFSDGQVARCAVNSTRPREFRASSQGFRCCSSN